MIDLYRSGATAKAVAENFAVSLRSVKRLLHQHGVRRERCSRGRRPACGCAGKHPRDWPPVALRPIGGEHHTMTD
jgi:hypothetical protein